MERRGEALRGFLGALSMVEDLLTLEQNYRNPPRQAEQPVVMGLRGGAAVLMVAAFEAFLRSLFEEKLSILTIQPLQVEFSRLPPKMQESSIYGTLERAMKGHPFGESRKRIERVPDIDRAVRHVVSGVVNPAAFSETGSNPSSERVSEMFKAAGCFNVFQAIRMAFDRLWHRAETTDFVADKLDEIVGRRHVVAHSASALDITRSDLREAVKFLKILARVLDSHLEQHVLALLD